MKTKHQIVLDQIPSESLLQLLDSLGSFEKEHGIRIRFKSDGRTSTPMEDYRDIVLRLLKQH
jgi:hypothetical protein